MKIHFQSTKDELALLQPAIPAAIPAYEKITTDADLTVAQIGTMQTVDNTPNGGGHCGFDGTGFVKGVQLISTNYANILGINATGQVTRIGNVLTVSAQESSLFLANDSGRLLLETRRLFSQVLSSTEKMVSGRGISQPSHINIYIPGQSIQREASYLASRIFKDVPNSKSFSKLLSQRFV